MEALKARYCRAALNNRDNLEYSVPVRWLDTVPSSKVFSEVDLFGNPNTVCKPTTPKWRHAVEWLKTRFPNWDK